MRYDKSQNRTAWITILAVVERVNVIRTEMTILAATASAFDILSVLKYPAKEYSKFIIANVINFVPHL